MYRTNFDTLDVILMVFGPPLLGCAVGLLLSLDRRRPGLAAIGGLLGGTAGAWVGFASYRSLVMPFGVDPGYFDACVLAGFLLGAIPEAWCMAGSKPLAAIRGGTPTKCGNGVGCGVAIAGVVSSCVGHVLYLHGNESDYFIGMPPEIKGLGVLTTLGGMAAMVFGLITVRRRRDRERGTGGSESASGGGTVGDRPRGRSSPSDEIAPP